MPFQPYHRFANCSKLVKLVTTLNDNGKITEETFKNFHRYYPALIHKLRSAKYNLEALKDKLTSTDIQEVAVTTGEFLFEVNMFIDGFFYNSGSALDILARVVLTLFGEQLTGNIYFHTAQTRLNSSRPGDPLLSRLVNPSWRVTFSNYRNTLTHELILASKYLIEIDPIGATPSTQIVFPLPDDPKAEPQDRKYRNHPNVAKYASVHFTRILSLSNTIYGDIFIRAESSGALPL